ncbi:MAG: GAF domain-containing protein [Candidatus Sulfotelmatobacter sp.]
MGTSASRSATASVSAGIAAANAHLPKSAELGPRFPAEDGGRSLAEMAYSDLDAALQLLVERAQYITGASGAAIALRRRENNSMLCRASAGSNAPGLGALLSMEYGLSGECVRTHQPQRCDDAERDARVNREVCRRLGIASVVVMPIVSEEHVLGVFELFSGKPRAFEERDLSALRRLGEMVETAVKYAAAAQNMPAVEEPVRAELHSAAEQSAPETSPVESPGGKIASEVVPAPRFKDLPQKDATPQAAEKEEQERTRPEPAPAPKKPVFWSAVMQTQGRADSADGAAASIAVPLGLRNLQKCQACGFPVSQGRTLCVECEEKQWRGQRLPSPAAGSGEPAFRPPDAQPEAQPQVMRAAVNAAAIPVGRDSYSSHASAPAMEPSSGALAMPAPVVGDAPQNVAENVPASEGSAPFLSSVLQPESWFAANKYILGALLVVAIIVGAIAWLR